MRFAFSSVIVKAVPNALFYVLCGARTPADRYSRKMASEGASGEQPPPVQTLATTVLGSVEAVRPFYIIARSICFYIFMIRFGIKAPGTGTMNTERRCISQ